MSERLINLIDRADEECKHTKDCKICSGYGKGSRCMNYHIADYLLANGVIVPPCKIADRIYQIDGIRIYTSSIHEITYTASKTIYVTESIVFDETAIGKSVFITREDAERALKGEKE